MLAKWVKSENPTLQIAAMRLLSDNDERQALNQQYIEHKIESRNITGITFEDTE